MNQLSPETRKLLDLACHEDDPEPGVRARVERSLMARVAVGAGAAAGATAAKSAAGASLGATAVQSAAFAGAATAVLTAGWLVLRPAPPPPPDGPPSAASVIPGDATQLDATQLDATQLDATQLDATPRKKPEPEETRRLAPPASLEDGREDATNSGLIPKSPARSRDPAEQQPSPATPPSADAPAPSESQRGAPDTALLTPDTLREETRALRAVQQALRVGSPERALTLLEQQQRRFQAGLLQEERAAARVLALCQSGRSARAREEAHAFERRWPRSPLLVRVRDACGPGLDERRREPEPATHPLKSDRNRDGE